jgi:hypothetical protein
MLPSLEFCRRAITNWSVRFTTRGGKRRSPSASCSSPERGRSLIWGTWSIVHLAASSPSWQSCILSWCWRWDICRIRDLTMKRTPLYYAILSLLVFFGGCHKRENDSSAIRAAINQHLGSLKTLNLSAMDVNITKVSMQGNQAQAQVEFRPKTGAPPGAGMQISYSLEKQNGKWVVQTSQPAGGVLAHPALTQNPHLNATPPASSTTMPNFNDLVHPGSGSSLPSGHPPVNSQGNMPPQ